MKIEEFLRKQKLQWHGHIKRMDERASVKSKKFVVNGSKKGRPNKSWKARVKDMQSRGLKRSDAKDCAV